MYALVASGFSLIYATCKFVHFAHGSVIAIAGYVLYLFFAVLGLNFWLAVLLTIVLCAFLGLAINALVYKKFRQRKASAVILLIASFALLILFESLILIFFGADVKTIGFIKIGKGLEFFNAIITPLQIVIIIIAAMLFGLLFLLMKKTKIGKAIRAVADNKDVAEIVGISAEKIYNYVFFLGSLIAGVAGVLVGLEQNLEPTMGTALMIKGFSGAVIGGINAVPGVILGSFYLALWKTSASGFYPLATKTPLPLSFCLFSFYLSPKVFWEKRNKRNRYFPVFL